MAADCQCSSPQPGEWVKGKVVGSGSFGTVHLAMNKANGGLFVVKSTQVSAGLESLKNEADILESLDSPYIVKCMGKDFSTESDNLLFLEYMAGGSLSDVAEDLGGMIEEEVIQLYTREILHGLKYLHENGIVHCDLKCKNLLLGSCGNIKLADFGCAKRVNKLKSDGQFIGGTPLWMAPEVLRNEGLDFASDIWSLGCTIIEMATGRAPWGDTVSNPMAAVLKIACGSQSPNYPTQFSKEGLDFLDKCLDRNQKMRWTAEDLLNHPFVSGQDFTKGLVSSPASVLDIETKEEEDEEECVGNESESDIRTAEHIISRNPFSTRHCGGIRIGRRRWQAASVFFSSENWITVRSG